MTDNTMVAQGIAYAERGWAVFPVDPDTKRPLINNWPNRATTNPKVIQNTWGDKPWAGMGIVTGSGLVVVDLDVKNGIDGPGNWDKYLETKGISLPETLRVKTRSGGEHRYYKVPEGAEYFNSAGMIDGVDVRGSGGFVVAPPTEGYSFLTELDGALPEMPVGLITEKPNVATGPREKHTSAEALTAFSAGLASITTATEGIRNDTLFKVAAQAAEFIADGLLDKDEAEFDLSLVALDAGLDPGETTKTIGSAFSKIQPRQDSEPKGHRHVVMTSTDTIKPRPVFWLWKDRLALGTLGLLAGREGTGKSTLSFWVVACITRGELPGEYLGKPKAVLVCATEDSWAHTIVPRLMAANADMSRVYKVEVMTAQNITEALSMPQDLEALENAAIQIDAALLVLDPLMSRLGELDTHKDAEVRQALEPLVAIADRTGMAVLGIIHHNKSGSTDPLQLVMGSKAFTAVARSLHTVVPDPDDDTGCQMIFGTPKNNLGRSDLPTLSFTIASHTVDTDEGPAVTGRLEWGMEIGSSIGEIMREAAETDGYRSATSEAADWLRDYVAMNGGIVLSADAKRDGVKAGHSANCLKRARQRAGLKVSSSGFPRVTYWEAESSVGSQSDQGLSGDSITDMTDTTGLQSEQLAQSTETGTVKRDPDPTGTAKRATYSRKGGVIT